MAGRVDLIKLRGQWITDICAGMVEVVGGCTALEPVAVAAAGGEEGLLGALIVGRIAVLVAEGRSSAEIADLVAGSGVVAGPDPRPESLLDLVGRVHERVGRDGITGSVRFLGYGLRSWNPESTYQLLLELWSARRCNAVPASRVMRELKDSWGVEDPGWLDACLSRPVDPLLSYPDWRVALKAERDVRAGSVAFRALCGSLTSDRAWLQWSEELPDGLLHAEHLGEVGGDLVRAADALRFLRREHGGVDAEMRQVMARARAIVEDQVGQMREAVDGLSTFERDLLRERGTEEHFRDNCLAELTDRSRVVSAAGFGYGNPPRRPRTACGGRCPGGP